MRIIDKVATTVGELIDILKEIPEDYAISITRMHAYSVAVDDENKSILLDDPNWIEEDVYSIENDC